MPDVQSALDMGISIFAGEAEGRIDDFLRDAANRTLKPIYNYIDDLPGLEGSVVPFLPQSHVKWTHRQHDSFDAGRGCPFQCSFCTIINVQGRKSRRRSPDDIERILRQNAGAGREPLFHHRRQFRPQQRLGDHLRPHYQAAGRGGHGRRAS